MIHPNTELRFINDVAGFGVVATQFIPKGTITWAMDKLDKLFEPNDLITLGKEYQPIIDKYAYRDGNGRYVLCWDIARFVNHSFNSNCITTAYGFELAIRDIQVDEQMTNDYGYLNVEETWECLPEIGSKRKYVMPDDLLNFYPEWDEKLTDAFKYFNKVEQPLALFLKNNTKQIAVKIANGTKQMDSILNCYYDRTNTKKKFLY